MLFHTIGSQILKNPLKLAILTSTRKNRLLCPIQVANCYRSMGEESKKRATGTLMVKTMGIPTVTAMDQINTYLLENTKTLMT
jgi:hypothetical protein